MMRVPGNLLYLGRDGLFYFEGEPFTGISYTTFPAGELESENEFRRGVQWGVHREFYRNGTLAEEGHRRDGVREGTWRKWEWAGALFREEVYEDGCPRIQRRWDADGRLREDTSLPDSDPRFTQIPDIVRESVFGTAPFGAGGELTVVEISRPLPPAHRLAETRYALDFRLRCKFPTYESGLLQLADLEGLAAEHHVDLAEQVAAAPLPYANLFATMLFDNPYCLVGGPLYQSFDRLDRLTSKSNVDVRQFPKVIDGHLVFLVVLVEISRSEMLPWRLQQVSVSLSTMAHEMTLLAEWLLPGIR